jgi:hypothetical protein
MSNDYAPLPQLTLPPPLLILKTQTMKATMMTMMMMMTTTTTTNLITLSTVLVVTMMRTLDSPFNANTVSLGNMATAWLLHPMTFLSTTFVNTVKLARLLLGKINTAAANPQQQQQANDRETLSLTRNILGIFSAGHPVATPG